ncbi:MAG: TIM barrel protein [Planctomycetes bacterium]|nr:TIM barrel protein [Planctomycetota bacterium]
MTRFALLVAIVAFTGASRVPAADPKPPAIYAQDNLVAWCIVPFDAKKRSPEDRAAMMKKLGFKKFAYDWRAEHLPTLDREIAALKKEGIELTAVWFPGGLNADAKVLLEALKKHEIKTQLWVTMNGGGAAKTPEEQAKKVQDHAKAIKPIADEAAKIGCTVALYNHGGWFGEPENQVAIIEELKLKNVGIVYNLHHGHDHLDRLPELLKKMKPHLLAFNLNGMIPDGERKGKKIIPLGQGSEDLKLMKLLADSGWTGPVGILGHTSDDAEERLKDNLDGFNWLLPQLSGKEPGPKPTPKTYKASAAPTTTPTAGWVAEGKKEYRTPPLTVECVAALTGKGGYNILIASDTKASGDHWELFTMPESGHFTAYLPGRKPDHVNSTANICDGKPHAVGMILEAEKVRLFVDGKEVALADAKPAGKAGVAGGLAFGRLVEGGIGCDGRVTKVRLSQGVREPAKVDDPLTADDTTVGRWELAKPGTEAADTSKLKNPAKPAASDTPVSLTIPLGPNLTPADLKWKATLIDRSPDEAYMAVKVDGTGRVFVGGREKVFRFDPDGASFKRRELLRLPPDSIVIGLEFRGDDLYVLAAHGLYLVPGGRVKTDGLAPKRILWGVPLDYHVSFHCLAWGPEGDLYLDHGDPLLGYGDWQRPDHHGCWTLFAGPTGEKFTYTGAGAVLRVRPDGSNLRVVAGGLRGPVGLAFDRNWNLFTNDNDHESMADRYAPAKLLHVTPQAHFGWPRGWMARKTPDRSDLIDCIHGSLGRGVPCDLAMFDEPTNASLRGNLLMCRWDRSAVTRYPLTPNGASFTATEHVFAQGSNNARPTGITVDGSGRVFVTSLYLTGNVVTPKCPSDLSVLTLADADSVKLFDETTADAEQLWAALASDSWDMRRRAHGEILRRDGAVLADSLRRLKLAKDTDAAAAHLPWLAAAAGNEAADLLAALAADAAKPTLRLHALRALTAFPNLKPPAKLFADALADSSATVRLAGLAHFLETDAAVPVDAVAKLAGGSDLVLRQAAVTLLARRASADELAKLTTAADSPTKLAGVLAVGSRLTLPPPHAAAPTGVKLHFPNDSAFFSTKLRFADANEPIALAALGPVGSYTTAQKWAAVKPTADEERLFQLLLKALEDETDPVRNQAAFFLGLLRDVRAEPVIARVRLEAKTRGLKDLPPVVVSKVWRIGPFPEIADKHPIENGLIDLTATHAAGTAKLAWTEMVAEKGNVPSSGQGYFFFRVQGRDRQTALFNADGGPVRVWHNGRPVTAEGGAFVLDLQPGGNDLLVRVSGASALNLAVRAKTAPSIELPEKSDGATLAERLKAAKGAAVPAEFLAVDWATEFKKGDPVQGRKLFGTLGCAKCHAVTADQPGGGAPSLAESGKRFTAAHVAESVLLPDRVVAAEFRGTRVTTADGRVVIGLVVREAASEIELLLPDTTRVVVKLAEIEDRKPVAQSPMPAGLVKTPQELRDVIAYLLSDRPLPP